MRYEDVKLVSGNGYTVLLAQKIMSDIVEVFLVETELRATKIRQVGQISKFGVSIDQHSLFIATMDSSQVGINVNVIPLRPEERS